MNPLNHFAILTKKILKHDNNRVKKYFVKFFCKLNCINSNFQHFVFNCFFKLINIPGFYNETDNITYHSKIGIIVQKFFEVFLETNKEINDFLCHYLSAIEIRVINRRVFVYLMTAITNLIQKEVINSKVILNENVVSSLCKIIEGNIKTVTVYHKNVCWKALIGILGTCTKSKQNYEKLPHLLNLILENTFNETINLKYMNFDSQSKNYFILFENWFEKEQLNLNEGKYSSFIEMVKFEENQVFNHECNLNFLWFKIFYSLFRHKHDDSIITFKLFRDDLVKVFNPYMSIDQKKEILLNLKVITQFLNYLFLNSIMDYSNLRMIIEPLNSSINEVLIYLFNECLTDFNKLLTGHQETTTNLEKVCIIREMFNCLEEYILFISRFNLIEFDSTIGKSICKYLSQISELNFHKIQIIDLFTLDRLIQYLQFNLHCYLNLKIFNQFSSKFINFSEYENQLSFEYLLGFLKNVLFNQDNLEKVEKSLQIEKTIKVYNNIIVNLTKTFSFLSKIKPQILFDQSYLCVDFITDNLEKMNEGDLKYIFIYVQNYMQHLLNNSNIIDYDFINNYIERSIHVLNEKKENISFLNVNSFLQGFLSKKAIELFSSTSEGVEILTVLFNKMIDLNENKYHIFLRVASSMFFSFILEHPEYYMNLDEILINLSESRECRGEDSYLIENSPQYIVPPFNVKVKNIFSSENEDINKHGFFVRLNLLNVFEQMLKRINDFYSGSSSKELTEKMIKDYFSLILKLIEKIIKIVDKNSSSKIEMIFSTKHRKKLRMSQLLILLSKIFKISSINPNKLSTDSNNQINSFSTNLFSTAKNLFDKVNLASVRFYLDSFYMSYSLINTKFLEYLISKLRDPLTKPNLVTSCLIITSIIILNYQNKVNSHYTQEIYENLLSLCTSNVCNIRGYAQFFIFRISKGNSYFSTNNILSKNFIDYLEKNPNISKFFSKFDKIFSNYMSQFADISLMSILNSNIDEIYSEIIPIDLYNEFKSLASDLVPIENEDLTKNYISWRYFVEDEEKLILQKKFEEKTLDFQRKYKPEFSLITEEIESSKIKRLDIIIMASLIDKAPNLGGLARTCEVFNIGSMTIGSESYIGDPGFIAAASSAEKWLPMTVVPICDIEKYVLSYKKLGYSILGLEQTANSVPLGNFNFKEKSLVILGNEKSGIPQNLINIIDNCVIIPQFGNIRSLNVHVSAALMIWTIVNCVGKNI